MYLCINCLLYILWYAIRIFISHTIWTNSKYFFFFAKSIFHRFLLPFSRFFFLKTPTLRCICVKLWSSIEANRNYAREFGVVWSSFKVNDMIISFNGGQYKCLLISVSFKLLIRWSATKHVIFQLRSFACTFLHLNDSCGFKCKRKKKRCINEKFWIIEYAVKSFFSLFLLHSVVSNVHPVHLLCIKCINVLDAKPIFTQEIIVISIWY